MYSYSTDETSKCDHHSSRTRWTDRLLPVLASVFAARVEKRGFLKHWYSRVDARDGDKICGDTEDFLKYRHNMFFSKWHIEQVRPYAFNAGGSLIDSNIELLFGLLRTLPSSTGMLHTSLLIFRRKQHDAEKGR